MRLRPLGPTGLMVGDLALGTMTFGAESDESAAREMLDEFTHAGGTLIDLADVYQHGVAEEFTGRWIADRGGADDLVIATKARFRMGEGANDVGLGRAHLGRAVRASLRRLRVEAIDLYQVHCWDPLTPLEETLSALDALVREGLVRHVGISNFTGWQLQRAILLARHHDWAPPVTLQPQYNLLAREIEWELIPLCADEGIGVLPWSPLGGGWLTGKYDRGDGPTGATRLGEDPERGVEAWSKRDSERTWAVVDEVRSIAAARGVSPAQVALNWLRAQPTVCSVILGARTVEQLRDNLDAGAWELDEDELRRLDAVSAPATPDNPYGHILGESALRIAEAGAET